VRPESARIALGAAAAAVFLALCATLGDAWRGEAAISDVPVYRGYGDLVEGGAVPYRDVRLEYPPGALAAFVPPSLVTSGEGGYARAFAALMCICGVAAIVLATVALAGLGASPERTAVSLAVPAAAPLLLGPLLLTRFDLLPAAVTVGALAALVHGRDRLGALALGAAVAVKLYPAVLVPLLVAWAWRRHGRREALVALSLCAGVAVVVFLPFVVLSPDGVASSVWRQLGRPLQIESGGAAALLGLHHLAGMPLGWASSHGSQNLTGAVAAAAAVLTALAQAAVLVWLWARFARGPVDAERLVRFAAAALVAFVALGKVLSPQFLIWLLPVVPLVAPPVGIAAAVLLAFACLLTRGWFPGRYWELVRAFDGVASAVVAARDVVLLALLALLAWPLRDRAGGQARSP
jgi:hypothetical protein